MSFLVACLQADSQASTNTYRFYFNEDKTTPGLSSALLTSLSATSTLPTTSLSPPFSPEVLSYALALPYDYEGTALSAAGLYASDVITGADTFLPLATPGDTVEASVVVTSYGGRSATYTVSVAREASPGNSSVGGGGGADPLPERDELAWDTVSSASAPGCTWRPAVFRANSAGPYVCHVGTTTTQIELSHEQDGPGASQGYSVDAFVVVRSEGGQEEPASGPTSLLFGVNRFMLRVRDAGGNVQASYSFHVVRSPGSVSDLSSLSLTAEPSGDALVLQPPFNPATLGPYNATVGNLVNSVAVAATTADPAAQWFVEGEHLSLVAGEWNWVVVVVEAQDSSVQEYVVEIYRERSDDAAALSVTPRTGCSLDPPFPQAPPPPLSFYDGRYLCWLDNEVGSIPLS